MIKIMPIGKKIVPKANTCGFGNANGNIGSKNMWKL